MSGQTKDKKRRETVKRGRQRLGESREREREGGTLSSRTAAGRTGRAGASSRFLLCCSGHAAAAVRRLSRCIPVLRRCRRRRIRVTRL